MTTWKINKLIINYLFVTSRQLCKMLKKLTQSSPANLHCQNVPQDFLVQLISTEEGPGGLGGGGISHAVDSPDMLSRRFHSGLKRGKRV